VSATVERQRRRLRLDASDSGRILDRVIRRVARRLAREQPDDTVEDDSPPGSASSQVTCGLWPTRLRMTRLTGSSWGPGASSAVRSGDAA
jgi:hypothetical protein